MKTDDKGRCIDCGLIPRPDIARLKKEDHCRCDVEFNAIYDQFQGLLKQNSQNIQTLAERFLSDGNNASP